MMAMVVVVGVMVVVMVSMVRILPTVVALDVRVRMIVSRGCQSVNMSALSSMVDSANNADQEKEGKKRHYYLPSFGNHRR